MTPYRRAAPNSLHPLRRYPAARISSSKTAGRPLGETRGQTGVGPVTRSSWEITQSAMADDFRDPAQHHFGALPVAHTGRRPR